MLEGSLHDFSLPDVLRLLAFTSKTGRLVLRDGDRQGRIDLLDGRVRDASADAARLPLGRRVLGAGLASADELDAALAGLEVLPTDLQLARRLAQSADLDTSALADLVREQTIDATFDLLRWGVGSFRFDGSVETRGPSALDLALGVDELLDETSRRLDAWPSLAERTGPLGGVVAIRRPGREHAEVALPPDGWTLLSLVDGRRTLADLVDLCGQGEYRTRRAIGALVDEGVISVGEGDGLGPGQRLLRDHERLSAREVELGGAATAPEAQPATAATAATAATDVAAATDGADVADVTAADRREPAEATSRPVADISPPPAGGSPLSLADRLVADAHADAANEAPTGQQAPRTLPVREVPAAAADGPAATRPHGSPGDARPTSERPSGSGGRVRRLQAKVRDERLRTDPSVDETLVDRLIAGVEGL